MQHAERYLETHIARFPYAPMNGGLLDENLVHCKPPRKLFMQPMHLSLNLSSIRNIPFNRKCVLKFTCLPVKIIIAIDLTIPTISL